MNVFTYGSLMFEQVWSVVVEGTYAKTTARLFGYQRRKLRGEVYPALIPASNDDHVDGIIYRNVDSIDGNRLDRFEGGYYEKQIENVTLPGGLLIPAYVYVLKEEFRPLAENEPWDPEGFEKFGIQTFMAAFDGYGRIDPIKDIKKT